MQSDQGLHCLPCSLIKVYTVCHAVYQGLHCLLCSVSGSTLFAMQSDQDLYCLPFHLHPLVIFKYCMGRVKRIWYLSPMRAAKVQASLCIRAVSPEPPLPSHISSESRETFRQKARSLTPLNGWKCAVKIWHDGMLEDTKSLDAAHVIKPY